MITGAPLPPACNANERLWACTVAWYMGDVPFECDVQLLAQYCLISNNAKLISRLHNLSSARACTEGTRAYTAVRGRARPAKHKQRTKMECLELGLKTLGLVLIFYFFSISLTFYNKWILMVSTPAAASANHPLVALNNTLLPSLDLMSLHLGLPVPPLHHHDSPDSKVHHILGTPEGYLLCHQAPPSCTRVEGLHEAHGACW